MKRVIAGVILIAAAGYALSPRYIDSTPTNPVAKVESDSLQQTKSQAQDTPAQIIEVAPSEQVPADELTALVQKIEKLKSQLEDSGMLAQLKAGRVPKNEVAALAELVEQLNDLRAREIEIRLSRVQAQLDGAAK